MLSSRHLPSLVLRPERLLEGMDAQNRREVASFHGLKPNVAVDLGIPVSSRLGKFSLLFDDLKQHTHHKKASSRRLPCT